MQIDSRFVANYGCLWPYCVRVSWTFGVLTVKSSSENKAANIIKNLLKVFMNRLIQGFVSYLKNEILG